MNHHHHLHLNDDGYLPFPYSLQPLPVNLRHGLFAIGSFALLSLITTTVLLAFLSYRLFFSARSKSLRYNQALILIFNLLLADLQQAVAFVLNFHWARHNAILAPSVTCSAQGWFVLMGDLSSGLFSLAIAAQTFGTVVYHWQPRYRTFTIGVITIWLFSLVISMAGPLRNTGPESYFFTRATAWCWVRDDFEDERLYLHYLWIFICEFGSLALYAALFLNLRRTVANNSPLARIARFMLVYPVAYTILTLPLAAARMATSAGSPPTMTTFIVAGALMGSCGWVDVLLYTCTRRVLILVPDPSSHGASRAPVNTLRYGTITTIVNLKEVGDADTWPHGAGGASEENIVRLDQVVEITVEDVGEDGRGRGGLHGGQHPWMEGMGGKSDGDGGRGGGGGGGGSGRSGSIAGSGGVSLGERPRSLAGSR
ncbi:hypothetical protein EDC01DRAFT_751495 [Geopyxis carbonaria]|nr:hypothetical protein EDC01DRAFT_751495 [Geopyxis carbonaria]